MPRTSPPPGQYTIIMQLQAHYHGAYEECDIRVFDGKASISNELKLGGSGYSYQGNSGCLTANKISHNFPSGTGSLKLVLWAGEEQRASTGYRLAEAQFEPLEVGEYYYDIERHVTFKPSPTGSYFLSMELQNYEEDQWLWKDYNEFGKANF